MFPLTNDLAALEKAWEICLLVADRGAGKTWATAYWLINRGQLAPQQQLGWVGIWDNRYVLDLFHEINQALFPTLELEFHPTRSLLVFPNDSKLWLFNYRDWQRWRGLQFHYLGLDEVSAWQGDAGLNAYNAAMIGLRLGELPQAMANTSDVTTDLTLAIRRSQRSIVLERQKTDFNPNLTESFKQKQRKRDGTAGFRKDYEGDLL